MTVEATIQAILSADTFTQRIQQIRLVPQRHGTEDHGAIYAAVARELYMPTSPRISPTSPCRASSSTPGWWDERD